MSQEKIMPVAPKERIVALDFLRGFALLGILLMNIQSFAMPEAVAGLQENWLPSEAVIMAETAVYQSG